MKRVVWLALAVVLFSGAALATETENLGIRALPAPGKMKIDGKADDWNLTGGVFICADVETQRDTFAQWFHLMHDADHLYLLARWINPTAAKPSAKGDAESFATGNLRLRFIVTRPMLGKMISHWDCRRWAVSAAFGKQFRGKIRDTRKEGVRQAFAKDPSGNGYVQEIAIPWKLLTRGDTGARPAGNFIVTVEAIWAGGHRAKDIWKLKPGSVPDRSFTFMAYDDWGVATLEREGSVLPERTRLSDGRQFPVTLTDGRPEVNWKGLIQSKALKGFKTIKFTMPADGYVSMHIKDAEGMVIRQLLGAAYYDKGPQEVLWDGLTTPVWRTPGTIVPPGDYTASAIWHKGIGVRLRGFACNGGRAPWNNGPTTNWGGDHGAPVAVASDGEKVYIGWSGSEAGKALVVYDPKKGVVWKNSRSGIASCRLVAAGDGVVYGVSSLLYVMNASDGSYVRWKKKGEEGKKAQDGGPDSRMREIYEKSDYQGMRPEGLSIKNGKLYISSTDAKGMIAVVDHKTRKLLRTWPVPWPRHLHAVSDTLVYVVSGKNRIIPKDPTTGKRRVVVDKRIVALDPTTGETRVVVDKLNKPTGIGVDKEGLIYVGVGEYDNQVQVFSADGKLVKTIGRKGGRPPFGPWQGDGMLSIQGITIGPEGHLWVTESTGTPKRVSVWNTKTGKLVKEFFGPTHYGASGGTINPLDPDIMVGEGCEWRIDHKTGLGECTGVFADHYSGTARFCVGSNGRLYLVTGPPGHTKKPIPYTIYERTGLGKYSLRGRIGGGFGKRHPKTRFWADINGDRLQQANEIRYIDGRTTASGDTGLTLGMNADLTFYGKNDKLGPIRINLKGFTECGAPEYDLDNIEKLPVWGIATPSNKVLLSGWTKNKMYEAYDLTTGKLLWKYAAPFAGVHGSHYAPPPHVGLIRGSFGAVGSAKLPDPVGEFWVLNTNVGEWHVLTAEGFYLTRLFQGEWMKIRWPAEAIPGAVLDNCPSGSGGEDFGGSLVQGADGKIYIQTGKTGLWNVEVVGLESVKRLPPAAVVIGAPDRAKAEKILAARLRVKFGMKQLTIKKATPKFTGDLDRDFKDAQIISYMKYEIAGIRSAAAWDDEFLYLAWEVADKTPWINAAKLPEHMYLKGDTVDFQLGADPAAKKGRALATTGDLRLSIGNFMGKPTVVIYRKKSLIKIPKTFSSGIVAKHVMEMVAVLGGAKVEVKIKPRIGYVIEAAIPLSVLTLDPTGGLRVTGDFGATHGGADGARTRLRTYWNNTKTGLVDDAVLELKMVPSTWGELTFTK